MPMDLVSYTNQRNTEGGFTHFMALLGPGWIESWDRWGEILVLTHPASGVFYVGDGTFMSLGDEIARLATERLTHATTCMTGQVSMRIGKVDGELTVSIA